MSLSSLGKYRRTISGALLLLFLSLIADIPVFAQDQASSEAHGSNVKWVVTANHIVINYDLEGMSNVEYTVNIEMRNDHDSSFVIVPTTVEGDVGAGVIAGKDHEIRWYFRNDYPLGFSGKGYYFKVLIKPVEQKSNMVYYIIGGATVTIGIIALLLGSKSADQAPATSSGLPGPPGRP